jgi:two-component system, NtrC family, response regulator AtoC
MSYFDFDAFQFEDKKMNDMRQLALQLAPTQASLLIHGAAGTGKTSLARYIFTKSKSPILHELNCNQPELFDFTACQGGTLLIEDLDCARQGTQAELMKLVERTGPNRPRFISTTRADMRAMVKQQLFRQDLFYKLAVVHLDVPNLVERQNDFENIAKFILEVAQIIHGKSDLHLSADASERLQRWTWPGNIRELENVLERAVVLTSNGAIGADSIQFESVAGEMGLHFAPGMSLSDLEKRLILQTLELTAQNRTRAAHMLGISIRTLRNKINEYKCEGVL